MNDSGISELLTRWGLVQDGGCDLIIADLPLPEWFQKRSPNFPTYQENKETFLKKAAAYSGVRYMNLQCLADFADDSSFFDATHPKNNAAKSRSRQLRKRWQHDGPDLTHPSETSPAEMSVFRD